MNILKASTGEEYSFDFVDELPESYKCTNCHRFLGEPYQNAECGDRFCGDCVQTITNGTRKCPACGELMTKDKTFVDAAVKREISALRARCPFTSNGCEQTPLYKNLMEHIESCPNKPISAVASGSGVPAAAIVSLERRVDKLEKIVQDLQLKFDGVNNQVSSLVLWKSNLTMGGGGGDAGATRQIGEMARRLQTLEEIAQGASLVHGSISFDANALETRISGLTASLQDVFARVDLHEQTSHDGLLIWKIDNFRQKKKEAVDGVRRSVYSSPFYSHRFGYKMCARAYLNGDGIGRGEYLSLFFVLMKGEYDAILDFPFPLRVKFTLLDQDTHSRNLSDSFDPDPKSSSFQRPTSALNVGAGCPKFVRHSIVETPTYLKDDCIYLRIAVGKD